VNIKPRAIDYMFYFFNYGFVLNTFNKFDSDLLGAVIIGEKLNMSILFLRSQLQLLKLLIIVK
jgi:inorganic pyrophosphatase